MAKDGRLYLSSEPTDMGNEEYISQFLDRLLEIYSLEQLEGLSKKRLSQELSRARTDFLVLKSRFSQGDLVQKSEELGRIAQGDDYRDLGELTTEQRFEIEWTKQEIERNFDRALVEAQRRRLHELGRILGPIQAALSGFGSGMAVNIDVTFEN